MSDAQEADLRLYLDQRRKEIDVSVKKGREQNLASMSAKGQLNSGAAIKNGVAALEAHVSDYIAEIARLVDRWSGPALPASRCRQVIAAHMREVVNELVSRDNAYREGSRGLRSESVSKAFDGLIDGVREKLGARVREFELSADQDRDQVAAAIQDLVAQVAALSSDLAAKIEPDALTILSQLEKPAPNSTILQEAGKSIRTAVEGAAGGAIGGALTPAVARALEILSKAVGLG